ncbi:cytochrome P450 [Mangrovihabitans endophyticus]|uniref:Cytochrome P450 n=1 Tax=Mangrovihabitans endophyticus TaxID=1751298 RepID=A0A8J3BTV2_9ACTN|nr:cytochrome P450 [Mangrovihabitans endophyticus]GGK78018.1 cytochrome P450 [Mangrovihabitans endophyticus]
MEDTAPPPFPFANPAPLQPPTEWAQLRQRCPVATVTLPSGDPTMLVTRHADVKQVLSDPRFPRSAADAARLSDTATGGLFNSEMSRTLPQHGEEHQRWRRLISKWFTVKRIRALQPRIEAMADRLIDDMTATGAPADLKASFAFPLPVWVICDMLGVPDSERDKFSYWSDTMLSLTRCTEEEMRVAAGEFLAYMRGHVAAKRAHPGDDLLSDLIQGGGLTDDVLVYTGQGLLVAGHETTANMIGKMIAMLLAEPARWADLCADPSLVPTAVEEALRFDAHPGLGMTRYLTEELTVAGRRLPAGTSVMCSMGAANRDEAVYPDAERMDLTRTPNAHLAFGSGPHSCVGQALARTELQVALQVLLRRLPSLRLAVPPATLEPLDGLVVGGLREVPVHW